MAVVRKSRKTKSIEAENPSEPGEEPSIAESTAESSSAPGEDAGILPAGVSPLTISLEQALELLSQPKQARGRRGAASKVQEPLKAFGESPVTGNPIKLLSGRYGDYITDGETNATLPKTLSAEDLTFDRALELLADKAAKGPVAKGKKTVKKTVKKAAVKKAAKKTR